MTPALAERDSLDIFFFPLRPDILPQFPSQLAYTVTSQHYTVLVLRRLLPAPGALCAPLPGRRFGPHGAGAGQDSLPFFRFYLCVSMAASGSSPGRG